jgi:hypothetical protein
LLKINKLLLSGRYNTKESQVVLSNYFLSPAVGMKKWSLRSYIARHHKLSTCDIPFYITSHWGARTDHTKDYFNYLERLYKNFILHLDM